VIDSRNLSSEAKKYRLNLNLTNQSLDQLPEGIKKSILGNIGTLIYFRLGSQDAQELEPEFSPEFSVGDLQALDKYQVYLKLFINGLASRPFSVKTFEPAPAGKREAGREALIKVSRQRYAARRETIEAKINKWLTKAA
jgi:hypothetical protein